MSGRHPNGDDIGRMLRDQGPVKAPPDLADEVMRQVRAEPRHEPRARRFHFAPRKMLVPALGLAAAAALVVGVTHLGNMSASSSSAGGSVAAPLAGSSSGSGGAGAQRSIRKTPDHRSVTPGSAFRISSDAAKKLSVFGLLQPRATAGSSSQTAAPNVTAPYTLVVPASRYRLALARLRALSAEHRRHQHRPSVLVTLRRKP